LAPEGAFPKSPHSDYPLVYTSIRIGQLLMFVV
jgi:hypothetical protein